MSKRKLLLADDSVTIQKVVNLTFADEGIEVIAVGDGDSAMEKVVENTPDLIMADVNMPGLTGYEICERIRQTEHLRHIPVILLVGSFEPFDENEALRVGADDFLTKPFQSIRQLVNKVTVLLNRNQENVDVQKESGSFEDTLELDSEEVPSISQYSDTSLDDEMIQTNRPSVFSFDETQRFESRETGDLGVAPQFETTESEVEKEPERIADEIEEETISPRIDDSIGFTERIEEADGMTEEVEETESVTYEIKDEEPIDLEAESKSFLEESEIENDITSQTKDEVTDQILETEDVSDDVKEDVLDEVKEEISETAPLEIDEEVTTTAEVEEEISDEIESEKLCSEKIEEEMVSEWGEEDDEPTVSEQIEEKQEEIIPAETEEVLETVDSEEETVLTETDGEVSEEVTKEYELVSEAEPLNEEVVEETTDFEEIEPVQEVPTVETAESESESTLEANESAKIDHEEEVPLPTFATLDEEIPMPEFVSVLETDEDNILQLPPIELDIDEPVATNGSQTAGFVSISESNQTLNPNQISSELVELIVAKVIEQLSENAVKEVAWEVVPSMSEIIIRKLAEEKLK